MMRPEFLERAFTFTIGGADGPTSVFLAGKIGGFEIFLGVCIVLTVALAVFCFARKRRR